MGVKEEQKFFWSFLQAKNSQNVWGNEHSKSGVHTAGVSSHGHSTSSIISVVVCVPFVHLED